MGTAICTCFQTRANDKYRALTNEDAIFYEMNYRSGRTIGSANYFSNPLGELIAGRLKPKSIYRVDIAEPQQAKSAMNPMMLHSRGRWIGNSAEKQPLSWFQPLIAYKEPGSNILLYLLISKSSRSPQWLELVATSLHSGFITTSRNTAGHFQAPTYVSTFQSLSVRFTLWELGVVKGAPWKSLCKISFWLIAYILTTIFRTAMRFKIPYCQSYERTLEDPYERISG